MTLSIIIIAIVVIAAIVGLILAIKYKGLKETAYHLICEVENVYKKGQGTAKFNEVFNRLYELIPAYLRLFLTEKAVKSLIQKVFDKTKEALEASPKKK